MARRNNTRGRDNDPRAYMGGAYLNGLVSKVSITPLDKWNDKTVTKGDPSGIALFVGFRCYRPYRKELTP